LELSKKEFQKQLSCELARSICNNMLRHRAALSMEFVSMSCRYVSALCRSNQECTIAATTCAKAAEALVQENEKEYLELCGQSCDRCTLSKKAREEWKKAVEKAGLICGEKQSEVYR
jgi:hypothetical protein